ncbi:DUF4974 domain-containing protein [Pseudoflavitalea sp. G-6-1-2]|uniref:FecR family protein n=1 Tax=Pseudoflavitalea sp. G-6-1-2 TaxID=2728841 RepID=UPI00146C036E|nr:FecR domain-containing protein [Pseudoflavitalea sp. G-6-1-2]NML23119.1 DUF4974 domain-containing protein [Pseudoflavitalea sp. G-6-1-2]
MGSKHLTKKQISRLAEKYIAGTATAEECALLHNWYDTINPGNTETVLVDQPVTNQEMNEEIFASLQQKIEQDRYHLMKLPRRSAQWWQAAAAILIVIAGASAYYFFSSSPTKKIPPATTIAAAKEVHAPQQARAVITLANGEQLYLDSLSEGAITYEGNAKLVKKEDGLVYESATKTNELQYNLLTVPRGSRVVNLTLSDGSRVWLNAESSIRYPVAFAANARLVEITGEVYFEVSKDPKRRFSVTSNGLTTEVLGTSFNINTYSDEPSMKVTLLQGSVQVHYKNGKEVQLKPGEQASVNNTSSLQVLHNIDTEAVIAWKNETFVMKGMDLDALARQMARWYDIQVVFESTVPDRKFGGTISRNVNLSTMLKALQESGIESRIENRRVIIQ